MPRVSWSTLFKNFNRQTFLVRRMATFPENLVTKDMYNCVSIDFTQDLKDPLTEETFQSNLDASEIQWKQQGIRAIWFRIPLNLSHFIPILVKDNFVYHHAKRQ